MLAFNVILFLFCLKYPHMKLIFKIILEYLNDNFIYSTVLLLCFCYKNSYHLLINISYTHGFLAEFVPSSIFLQPCKSDM